jgi:hypothetical protein
MNNVFVLPGVKRCILDFSERIQIIHLISATENNSKPFAVIKAENPDYKPICENIILWKKKK